MLADVITREGVLKAIAEFDEIGEVAFLRRYGFGKARHHFVRHNGKFYPSKAILGVGQKYSVPDYNGAEKLNRFYGGKPTIDRLTELGFWVVPSQVKSNLDFEEGERYSAEAQFFVRSPELVKTAKLTHGYLCQACGFDFEDFYGSLGAQYIECHHIDPLSERRSSANTSVENVAVLCSNCHRMVHRERPALSVKELQDRIAVARAKKINL